MITVTHSFQVIGTCPVNGARDEYAVKIMFRRDKPSECPIVEFIQAQASEFMVKPMTQEEFTFRMSQSMRATVTTQGSHGDFETVCKCEADQ